MNCLLFEKPVCFNQCVVLGDANSFERGRGADRQTKHSSMTSTPPIVKRETADTYSSKPLFSLFPTFHGSKGRMTAHSLSCGITTGSNHHGVPYQVTTGNRKPCRGGHFPSIKTWRMNNILISFIVTNR